MPNGRPDGLVSFAYHIMYDPEINKRFVEGPVITLINSFGITGSLANTLKNGGQAAGPDVDQSMAPMRSALFDELKDKFHNKGPLPGFPAPGAKPKSLLSLIYNVIYNPQFRSDFTSSSAARLMEFFTIASYLHAPLWIVWTWDRTTPQTEKVTRALELVREAVYAELNGNYLITW